MVSRYTPVFAGSGCRSINFTVAVGSQAMLAWTYTTISPNIDILFENWNRTEMWKFSVHRSWVLSSHMIDLTSDVDTPLLHSNLWAFPVTGGGCSTYWWSHEAAGGADVPELLQLVYMADEETCSIRIQYSNIENCMISRVIGSQVS